MFGVAVDQSHDVFVSALNAVNRAVHRGVRRRSERLVHVHATRSRAESKLPVSGDAARLRGQRRRRQPGSAVDRRVFAAELELDGDAGRDRRRDGVAFTSDGTKLFAAYLNNRAVVEFAYPSGKQVNEIIAGLYDRRRWPSILNHPWLRK